MHLYVTSGANVLGYGVDGYDHWLRLRRFLASQSLPRTNAYSITIENEAVSLCGR